MWAAIAIAAVLVITILTIARPLLFASIDPAIAAALYASSLLRRACTAADNVEVQAGVM